METEKDVEYLKSLVMPLCQKADKIKINRTIDERGVLLTIKADPVDIGAIIGKEGFTAKAIRRLLTTFGAKEDARIAVKIDDGKVSKD